jgi:uncharacterized lipoprotein
MEQTKSFLSRYAKTPASNWALTSCMVLSLLTAGCASLEKKSYVVCPYDTVWEAASDTMKSFHVTVRDKEKGLIETAWSEMASSERGFGVFQRNAFDNKERARMTLTLNQLNNVTKVVVSEERQRWHVRGGVSQQALKWTPVEPSEEAMTAVMNQLNAKLENRGCTP